MKNLVFVLTVVTMLFPFQSEALSDNFKINLNFGEEVKVVNNLNHEVHISYKAVGFLTREEKTIALPSGEHKTIKNLRKGEHLIAQVIGAGGVIGTTDERIRGERRGRQQIWRINRYRRVR